jgi:hypothetical protein
MADAFFILDFFLNICTPVFEKHSREKVNVQGLREGTEWSFHPPNK